MRTVSGISHVAIVTRDARRLAAFYCELLDGELIAVDDTPFGPLATVKLGAGAMNLFEIAGNDHADGLPAMFTRGHVDHLGFTASSAADFWALRQRLVDRGCSDGEVTDFGAVLGVSFTDPDGAVMEINLLVDERLQGLHEPRPYTAFDAR